MNAKEKIMKAFFELLTLKEFQDINVSEICRVSKVHRTTFYAYFENTFELLLEAKDEALLALSKRIGGNEGKIDYLSEKVVLEYLSFLKEYPNLFKAFLTNGEALGAEDIFRMILEKYFITEAKRNGARDEHSIYLSSLFKGASGLLHLPSNGCQEKEDLIAKILIGFGTGNR